MDNMVKVKNCWWCNSTDLKRVAKRKDNIGVVECQKCHLLLVAERPEDLSVYYDEEAYFNPDSTTETGYHENYDLLSPFYLYWQGALINEVVRLSNAKTLLEVGCATGNALEMMKLFTDNLSVHGIDLSPYAIDVCKGKGLTAAVSTINDFESKNKFDIIFSSETMEHVDDLHDFVDNVKNNLKDTGTFVFYVPAVEKKALIKESENYPSLATSLEHVSYFTQEFLDNALSNVFDSTFVKMMSTTGESYFLGIASNDKNIVSYMKSFIEAFENDHELPSKDPQSIYNLAAISAKFGRFDLASRYLEQVKKSKIEKSKVSFLEGLLSYNKGELINARKSFLKYVSETQVNSFILKVLLTVERELVQIESDQSVARLENVKQLETRIHTTESELMAIKNSRVVGNILKFRTFIGPVMNPLINKKKK